MVTHVLAGLERRFCNWLLRMAQYIIHTALSRAYEHVAIPLREKMLLQDMPRDIRSVRRKWDLEGKTVLYAACPSCHKLHKVVYEKGKPLVATHCSNKAFPGGRACGELLLSPRIIHGKVVSAPILPFLYHDFKDWLASLMARPGIEDAMDRSWKESSDRRRKGIRTDILDGTVLSEFKGPDGKTLYSVGCGEARYVFSLCIDFFNPRMNKAAGKSTSCGIVSLVCLNLPAGIRYKNENMFLAGIIPGPKEPPLNSMNHYLTPLIDDFLILWTSGVQFSSTSNFANGRVVRCAIVALVCDMPGARKAGGLGSLHHNRFCYMCKCSGAEDLQRVDYRNWIPRTGAELRSASEEWRNAPTKAAQDALFAEHGVRWTELSRLPYWDSRRFIVVDAMHNLFLNLVKHHFRAVLGLDIQQGTDEGDAARVTPVSDQHDQMARHIETIKKWIYDRNIKIKSCKLEAWDWVCRDLGLSVPPSNKKQPYMDALVTYVGCSHVYRMPDPLIHIRVSLTKPMSAKLQFLHQQGRTNPS